MKITLNAIRQLNERYQSAGDVTAIGQDKLIEKIGAQLGAIDEVVELGPKYQGVVIARVVSCEKHPNADKLSLCKIDDGGAVKAVERDASGRVQVVCGAPNVREGLTVAWLPPGTTVPETYDKEPFVLEAREIRGHTSNGMLASPKELALGDSHAGILEIDGDHQPGSDFAAEFKLADEVVLDIENKMFTHRPDLFGWLGIDRELAGIQGMHFKSPDWYVVNPEFPKPAGEALSLTVKNELPELVPRFSVLVMREVQVGPSPLWLQVLLAKVGQKSINNVVDLTNYYMLLTGQPLHAYDYDKLKTLSGGEPTIVVRNPKPGEKVALLNGKTIEPRTEAIMIATDQQLIGMGGIMGGSETEVDETTKNVILECANFDMYSTRRTSMAHGLFTDAATRFTKGQSPLQTLPVLAQMAADVASLAVGRVASPLIDDNHLDKSMVERQSVCPPVTVSADFINTRLGLKLSAEEMKQLLENVEFKVAVNNQELTITAPFWRTDVELREDVVEEIGRLYGYDHLPLELPRRDLTPAAKDSLLETKQQIRDRLSRAGANEVLTYSFVHGDLLTKVGQDPENAFRVANALSPDLQFYRLSLMPSLLEKVHPNLKAGYDAFALFELGIAHVADQTDEESLPREDNLTALVVTAADKLKKASAPYYEARKYLTELVPTKLTFKAVPAEMQSFDIVKPYDAGRTAFVYAGDTFVGIIGELRTTVRRSLKLPRYTAGFEVDTTVLATLLKEGKSYTPLPRFPKVNQDLSLKVATKLDYQDLCNLLDDELQKLTAERTIASLQPLDIYQSKDDNEHKHVTFRLQIASYERTLTDGEVNDLLDKLAAAVKTKFGAERI